MSLKYRIVPVTPFEQNCTLIWCEDTQKAAVIDPGGDLDRIRSAIAAEGVTVEKILLTHAHLDHVGGTAELARTAGIPIEGPHKEDNFWIQGCPCRRRCLASRRRKSSHPTAGWKMATR